MLENFLKVLGLLAMGLGIGVIIGVIYQAPKNEATIDRLCFPYQVEHSYKQNGKWIAICRSEDGGLVIKQ